MKVYIKLISVVLALVFVLAGVSLVGVSAEDTYTQPEKFIYGDVNLDGKVTVKDATLIQKGLAKITYVTAVQRYLADPDGTGYSVKNATAIQKYLAKYEASPLFGTELTMASQDEFSKEIPNASQLYEDDLILISPKISNSMEYVLADFPEYEFSSIEKISGENNADSPAVYALYLKNRSKTDVVNAIKALDCRANLDLKFASVNSLSFEDISSSNIATDDSPMVFDGEVRENKAFGKDIAFTQTASDVYDSDVSDDYYMGVRFLVYTEYNQDIDKLDKIEEVDLKAKYDEEYFSDNILIIMWNIGSSDINYRVNNIKSRNNILGINYTKLFPEGGAIHSDVINSRVYIEIDKEDLPYISNIEVFTDFDVYSK